MLARLFTFSLDGIDALPVEVEVDVSPGALPKTTVVGLPEGAVRESIHRVERALVNSGFFRPENRVVVNLAPADLPKQAASFDLPMTLGMLAASGQFDSDRLTTYAAVGELSLEGTTRPIKGALSMAMAAAKQEGLTGLLVPRANAEEAAVVESIAIIPIDSLSQAVAFLAGEVDLAPMPSSVRTYFDRHAEYDVDFVDVRGQEMAKRAVTIAAAGGHNLLMLGPPGSGKTMLAKRLPTILPVLSPGESVETTRIYSAVGRLPDGVPLLVRRPFRAPHHTISEAGLVGGGSIPTPGEISLSHHGVLFLDELPEFNRRTLEVLRQPLEDRHVTISRARGVTVFPADFMLVAALNPCPCGYRGDPRRDCKCSAPQIEKYMARISGPLLDRIDIHLEVPAVPYDELSSKTAGRSSEALRADVLAARAVQADRLAGQPVRNNAQLSSRLVRQLCRLDRAGVDLLKTAVEEMGLSARAHDKILRVARTIADLDGAAEIAVPHLAEAINYRILDRKLWA